MPGVKFPPDHRPMPSKPVSTGAAFSIAMPGGGLAPPSPSAGIGAASPPPPPPPPQPGAAFRLSAGTKALNLNIPSKAPPAHRPHPTAPAPAAPARRGPAPAPAPIPPGYKPPERSYVQSLFDNLEAQKNAPPAAAPPPPATIGSADFAPPAPPPPPQFPDGRFPSSVPVSPVLPMSTGPGLSLPPPDLAMPSPPLYVSPPAPPPPPAIESAHAIVTSAAGGDESAQGAILSIVDGARAGDPHAVAQADILTHVQKLQIRSYYVDKWVHGIGT